MEILVLGLNYKTAPVEIREKLSIPAKDAQIFLKRFEDRRIFTEQVLLSTCNRTEIYGVVDNDRKAIQSTKEIFSDYSSLDLSLFEDKLYVMKQPDSVRHLFSVASGLDSMVVGETEITGQVKDAYQAAHQHRHTGKVLNNLFQRSLKVAKNLRTHTGIGTGRVSVASVAVDLAEKIFEDLKNTRVMVIGTGEMATQLLKAMIARGAFPYIVSSHDPERARALEREFGGQAIPFNGFEAKIPQVDIVLSSTLSSQCLITEPQVRRWMKTRHDKPLFLLDIAMPRNIEAAIEKLDNVYLYNIDDLQEIAERNKSLLQIELKECSGLVQTQTQYFMDWLTKEFGSCPAASVLTEKR